MAMGKADLKAKVCALPAKYCLFLLCIAHVFVFLVVTGVVVYVYFTNQTTTYNGNTYTKPLEAGFFILLVPGVLALISGLGALMFLCVRAKLLMLICIVWPVVVGLAAACFYGIFIITWSSEGTTVTNSKNSNEKIHFSTPVIVAISIGMLILPLSCCCCVVLACMGFNKSDDGSGTSQMKSPGKSQGKSQMNNNNGNQGQGQFNGNGGGFQGNQNGNGNGNGNWNNNNNNGGNQMQMQNQNPGGNGGNGGGGNHGGGHKREQNHSGHLY